MMGFDDRYLYLLVSLVSSTDMIKMVILLEVRSEGVMKMVARKTPSAPKHYLFHFNVLAGHPKDKYFITHFVKEFCWLIISCYCLRLLQNVSHCCTKQSIPSPARSTNISQRIFMWLGAIDIFSLLQRTGFGEQYVFVFIDRYTILAKAFPMSAVINTHPCFSKRATLFPPIRGHSSLPIMDSASFNILCCCLWCLGVKHEMSTVYHQI